MRKRHQKYMIQAEINVVPFLDILLILLVIFMMLPSQLIQSFEVNLPNSTITTNIIHTHKSSLTIEVKETGLYNVFINNKNIKNVRLDQLHAIINNIDCISSNMICWIAASRNVEYDAVVQVLNILSSIGISAVGMITEPR